MTPSESRIRNFIRDYKTLLMLASAALVAELAYAILNLSGMPMYVDKTLGRLSQMGFILGAFLGAEALSRPMLGALGDKIGRKPLMLAGPAITAITAYLTILYQGPYVLPYLMVLRVLDGLGSSALWMNAFAAVGDVVGENRRSTAMSVLNVTYMGGMSMGFLLGGIVNDHFHTLNASFYLASGLFVLALFVLLAFFPSTPKGAHHAEVPLEETVDFKPSHILRSFREVPDMVVMAMVTFVGMGMLTPIVKVYAFNHLGLSETQFGIFVAPIAAAMGLCAVPLGHLGDKYGKTTAVCWGLFAAAIAMWVLALYKVLILVALAGVVIGLGFTVAFPAWNALVISSTTAQRRGEVLGAVGLAQGLAAWIGTLIGPLIYESDALSFPRLGIVNYNVPFWLSAISISGGAVICFTWVCAKRAGGSATEERVTHSQRRLIVAAAIIGFMALASWIGYRYVRPVSPDRVAWSWVQQAARNRPEKAMKYALMEAPGWNGHQATFGAAPTYHKWVYGDKAGYTVFHPDYLSDNRAEVSVKFNFPGGAAAFQTITLCRLAKGQEWKVCGVRSEPEAGP